jgi:hypothetical protein
MEEFSMGSREKLLDGCGALGDLCLKFKVMAFHGPA